LWERGDREQFSNERRVIISALEKRQIEKLISDVRVDGGIKTVDVQTEAEDRSEGGMISHL
jgi:hypothetical protein